MTEAITCGMCARFVPDSEDKSVGECTCASPFWAEGSGYPIKASETAASWCNRFVEKQKVKDLKGWIRIEDQEPPRDTLLAFSGLEKDICIGEVYGSGGGKHVMCVCEDSSWPMDALAYWRPLGFERPNYEADEAYWSKRQENFLKGLDRKTDFTDLT